LPPSHSDRFTPGMHWIGGWLESPHLKIDQLVMKYYTGPRIWTGSLERSTQRKMDIRFGIWNVRSLCRAGSRKTGASELAKYIT
jgi:hypothetical protein